MREHLRGNDSLADLIGLPARKFSGRKRRCQVPKCRTILTMYNPSSFCFAHQGAGYERVSGKR